MAKVSRDTALRSVASVLNTLPANAVVHLVNDGPPPPGGDAGVKVIVRIQFPRAIPPLPDPPGEPWIRTAKAPPGLSRSSGLEPMPPTPDSGEEGET